MHHRTFIDDRRRSELVIINDTAPKLGCAEKNYFATWSAHYFANDLRHPRKFWNCDQWGAPLVPLNLEDRHRDGVAFLWKSGSALLHAHHPRIVILAQDRYAQAEITLDPDAKRTFAQLGDQYLKQATDLQRGCAAQLEWARAAKVHDRMSVLLASNQFESWSSGRAGTEILKPAPDRMITVRPVSERVNSSRADDSNPTLIDTVAAWTTVEVKGCGDDAGMIEPEGARCVAFRLFRGVAEMHSVVANSLYRHGSRGWRSSDTLNNFNEWTWNNLFEDRAHQIIITYCPTFSWSSSTAVHSLGRGASAGATTA